MLNILREVYQTERSCICVLGVSILPLSTIFRLHFELIVPTVCWFFFILFYYYPNELGIKDQTAARNVAGK